MVKWKEINWNYEIRRHLSDATAANICLLPFSTLIETQFRGIQFFESAKARGTMVLASYMFLGSMPKIRDLVGRKIGITDKSPEWIKGPFEAVFNFTSATSCNIASYALTGELDKNKIMASLAIGGVNLLLGWPFFYSVDVTRELTGVQETRRTPRFIKEKSPKYKRRLLMGAVATMIAGMSLYYQFAPDRAYNKILESPIEQIVNE